MSFFEMGGYAGFVWPSYAITALVMVGLLMVSLRELRDRERTLAALEAARDSTRLGRRRRGESGPGSAA
jgi:heme exporter protein D